MTDMHACNYANAVLSQTVDAAMESYAVAGLLTLLEVVGLLRLATTGGGSDTHAISYELLARHPQLICAYWPNESA
jgi:hypothetical protein